MALIGKAGLLRDPSKRPMSLAQQAFCALNPTLNNITLRPNPGRLLTSN